MRAVERSRLYLLQRRHVKYVNARLFMSRSRFCIYFFPTRSFKRTSISLQFDVMYASKGRVKMQNHGVDSESHR